MVKNLNGISKCNTIQNILKGVLLGFKRTSNFKSHQTGRKNSMRVKTKTVEKTTTPNKLKGGTEKKEKKKQRKPYNVGEKTR